MAASEFLEDIKELLDGLDVQEQVDFPIELDELERGPTDFVSLTGRKIRGRGGKGILFRSYDPIRLANARKAAASRKMTERGDEPPTKTSRLTSGLVNEGRCKKNEEFFCLDCEGCCDLDCQHLLHPRKMIGKKQDVDLHKTLTEHTRLQPVSNFVKRIPEARAPALSEEEQQAAAQMEQVIGMDDDDDENFDLKNQEFFCLDCEGCCDLDCQHLLHPRKIIGRDLVLHYRQTQHTRVQPVNNFVMTKLGHVVRTEDPGI